MHDQAKAKPEATELFFAGLVATGLVYLAGIAIIAVLVAITSTEEPLRNAFTFLGFFATLGVGVAMVLGFLIVAPLATAWGKVMLRFTPAGWWQGPITGLLVSLTMVAMTLALFTFGEQPLDWGVYAMAAVPVVLSPIAGALVQRKMLNWPNGGRAAQAGA